MAAMGRNWWISEMERPAVAAIALGQGGRTAPLTPSGPERHGAANHRAPAPKENQPEK